MTFKPIFSKIYMVFKASLNIHALVGTPTIVKVELNIDRANSRFGIVVGELLPRRFLFCKKGLKDGQ